MQWLFAFASAAVKAELNALPADMRAYFERIVRLVNTVGLERVHEPYIKHLEHQLWEMRLHGRSGIARALYSRPPGGDPAGVCKEDAENPAAGNRVGVATRQEVACQEN